MPHNLSSQTFWDQDELVFEVNGSMREAVICSENFLLRRSIKTKTGDNRIEIIDEITNESYHENPLMILYHFNIGFPMLDDDTGLFIPIQSEVLDHIPGYKDNTASASEDSLLFYRLEEKKNTRVIVLNRTLDLAFYISFNTIELPYLSIWKCFKLQDFVLAIEPGNCLPIGRKKSSENGMIEYLKPGQKKSISIEIGVIERYSGN